MPQLTCGMLYVGQDRGNGVPAGIVWKKATLPDGKVLHLSAKARVEERPYGMHTSATCLMPSSMSWRRTRPLTRTIGPGLAPYPLHPPSRAQIQVAWASEPDG